MSENLSNRKKVLIIDDMAGQRDMIRELVEKLDCEVLEAGNGTDGLALAREHRPHLVITDVNMPGKDGIEVVMDVKRFLPQVKIITISGNDRTSSMDVLQMADILGADAVFEKPFVLKDFVEKVKELLG